MKRTLITTLILFSVLAATAVPSLIGQNVPGEVTEKKRTPDRVAAAYAHLLAIVAPPGNHTPEEVAARNAKLFADMNITPKQGEVLASIASQYRDYLQLSKLGIGDQETEPLPAIAPYDQIRVKPLSKFEQIVVLKHMIDFQGCINNEETQLRVTGYCEREILPKITIVHNNKD